MAAAQIFQRLLDFLLDCYAYLMDWGESVFIFFTLSFNSAIKTLVPGAPDISYDWADLTILELILQYLLPTVMAVWLLNFVIDKLITPWD